MYGSGPRIKNDCIIEGGTYGVELDERLEVRVVLGGVLQRPHRASSASRLLQPLSSTTLLLTTGARPFARRDRAPIAGKSAFPSVLRAHDAPALRSELQSTARKRTVDAVASLSAIFDLLNDVRESWMED